VIAPEIFQTGTTVYTKVINFCIEYPYELLFNAIHVGSSSFIEISNCNITASGDFTAGIFLGTVNCGIIKNNYIYNCSGSGIYVSASNYNVFLGNIFYNNSGWGGILFDRFRSGGTEHISNYSIICHNQFIDNGAWDRGNNTWYNPMMLTGNYWYNYDGYDLDNNGIGDIPYNLSGEGNSQDLYPLMEPWSEGENQPPEKPIILGPSEGKAGESCEYTISSIDPDGDDTIYLINWGDNTVEWSKIISSDNELIINHTWKERGSYVIKVRAFDINLSFSDWEILSVSMPKNKAINRPLISFLNRHQKIFPLLRSLLQLFQQ
jgi:parallel beta-helix repeat protein